MVAKLPAGMNFSNDSIRSLTSGMGDIGHDKLATAFHQNRILDDVQLSTIYRNSWIAKKIVDIPALDALRKGRDWQADQKQITKIEKEEKRLSLWLKLLECKQVARLKGGAAIVIGSRDDGEDYSKPFDASKVQKDGISHLTVMAKKELTAVDIENDPMSEWYGKPKFFQVSGQGFTGENVKIHPSRLVIQIGSNTLDPWGAAASTSFGWGDSVLQHTYDAMMQADSTSANIATLVFEANIDVVGIPDLMDKLSKKEYEQRLLNRLTLANVGKSVSKMLIHDDEETFDRKQINFASLPDLIQTFLLLVSGAADIPLTRFLGQAPTGLSATGEGDMKNYYDRVTAIQTLELEPAMQRLDEALVRSALGEYPDEIYYEWTPLEQMNEAQKAEIGLKNAQSAEILTRTGLFEVEELRTSVANQLIENGVYPGLADAMAKTGEFTPPDLGSDEDDLIGDVRFTDATPRTLYMRRDVVNAKEIADWYIAQGVKGVYKPESMHTTIIYSKTPVDWMKIGQSWNGELKIDAGGPRLHEKFGDMSDVLVLLFKSSELDWRHSSALEIGATSDFDEYQSHISISLDANGVDLATLKPWTGEILFGPELFEEVATGEWREKIVAHDLFA